MIRASIGDRIVVYSTLDDPQQATVENIWYKYYPNCTMEWVSDSVGKLVARARSEANNPQADVLFGGLFEFRRHRVSRHSSALHPHHRG